MTTEGKGTPSGKGDSGTSKSGQQEKSAEKPHWVAYVEAGCAVLLVFITGTYTYYAAGQLHKMKRSTDAAVKASVAAEGANTLAQLSNRAWLEIRMPAEFYVKTDITRALSERKFYDFPLKLTNIGKTPIKSILVDGNVEIKDSTVPLNLQDFRFPYHEGVNILFPTRDFEFADDIVAKGRDGSLIITPIEESDRRSFSDGTKYIIVYARAAFEDSVGQHWVEFCTPVRFKVGASYAYGDCINYNDAGDGMPPWAEKKP